MKPLKRTLLIAAALAILLIVGTAIVLSLKSPSGGETGSRTPLGAMFQRAADVSNLKEFMGELRGVYPAMMKFSQEHQDDLPKTMAELRPYLPANLAKLDDGQWEMPSNGKFTALTTSSSANSSVLLQQKNAPTGKGRMVVYADGHIEYKKTPGLD
jgi:hypothetical protein